ncbi:MAG: hypothetical protein V4487_03920 [Chlamydiota bacterium]
MRGKIRKILEIEQSEKKMVGIMRDIFDIGRHRWVASLAAASICIFCFILSYE